MAFPLKSGADLYNQQLIRAAIWNHGADPSETVTGLLYFNTSNSSAAKKLRLYTGSAWKTIAFEEDLDVANNAEFKALEDKVKLLAGEVDTDAIINNMKDVENFLAGFNESGGTLMNYLNAELGKKLDLSGGIITRSDRNLLCLTNSEDGAATLWFNNDFDYRQGGALIQHEKDTGAFFFTNMTTYAESGSFALASIYIPKEGGIFVANATLATKYPILHSGNIGKYNAGGAEKLVGTYHGSEDASSNPYFWLNESGKTRYYLQAYNGNLCLGPTEQSLVINSSGNVNIGASDLAGTSANLVVGNNVIFCYNQTIKGGVDNGNFIIDAGDYSGWFAKGFGIKHNGTTLGQYGFYLGESNLHYMFIGKYDSPWISIRPNGNVGIGTPDPQCKLDVDGIGRFSVGMSANEIILGSAGIYKGSYYTTALSDSDILYNARYHVFNGNVGIGLTNPSAQLHVAQDIVANGTIACKGIAAEGDAMEMVDKTVLYIIPNGTQQTFTLNHGLGTREITISIYEITTLGTNMILTDVEIIDDNNIMVSFGNPPSENHMVVVMG